MRTAICLYVRNEAAYLLEWMVHHAVVGFDTIIVMDNLSDDGTADVARGFGRHHDVRVATWDDTSRRSQLNCYEEVLLQVGAGFDWMAFVDSDEFIVPIGHGDVKAMLHQVGDHAAVGLNWAVFGSNNHVASPPGLVLENYTRRAPLDFAPNRHVKSIVRPDRTIRAAHPHLFHLRGERTSRRGVYRSDYVDCTGRLIRWGNGPGHTAGLPGFDVCRVNHYFTRARADWDRKMLRRWRDIERGAGEFGYHDRNEVEDRSALPFAAAVRQRMEAVLARERYAELAARRPAQNPSRSARETR